MKFFYKKFFFIAIINGGKMHRFSVIVPVEEEQAERHDEEEEQNVNAKASVALNCLLDLLVGFSDVLSGADDGVGNSLDDAFLKRNLEWELVMMTHFESIGLLTFSVKSSWSFAMS